MDSVGKLVVLNNGIGFATPSGGVVP